MALLWHPDYCPGTLGCILEVDQGQANLIRVHRLCAHHSALRDTLKSDGELFTAIRRTGMAKEQARASVKRSLRLPKEHPGVPFFVDTDGSIRIESGTIDEERKAIKAAADAEIEKVEIAPGMARIVVD